MTAANGSVQPTGNGVHEAAKAIGEAIADGNGFLPATLAQHRVLEEEHHVFRQLAKEAYHAGNDFGDDLLHQQTFGNVGDEGCDSTSHIGQELGEHGTVHAVLQIQPLGPAVGVDQYLAFLAHQQRTDDQQIGRCADSNALGRT